MSRMNILVLADDEYSRIQTNNRLLSSYFLFDNFIGLVLRFIAEGVTTRDGVCAYDSFCTSKFLKTKGLLCMREDRLAACGTRSS